MIASMKNGSYTDENGITRWYMNDKLHRENNEPAIIYPWGAREWYFNGNRHRECGPAIESEQAIEWYCHGLLHRVDGPAVQHPEGLRVWYLHGKKHRVDGPAIHYPKGDEYWFLNDVEYSRQEFEAIQLNKELDEKTVVEEKAIKV